MPASIETYIESIQRKPQKLHLKELNLLKRTITEVNKNTRADNVDKIDFVRSSLDKLADLVQANSISNKEFIDREIQKISQEYKVKVCNTYFRFEVPNVKIFHNGQHISLGDFTVRLTPSGSIPSSSYLRPTFDSTRRIDDLSHPHAYGKFSATVCLNKFSSPIQKALRAGRLYNAVILIDEFLHTYNDQSPYYNIMYWTFCQECGESLVNDKCVSCARS